ncbi:hypothetical protein C8A05DRAFT_35190 [Staphylotrichum tortipilum]|uniref:Zn(2)-C6 fungal-type domain-containing protein n=1 Tax=Staphylotrichum tortipilum TaxID=2831512 RepID=A0AAN6RT44_9PEZI|nr:hypothetical protein C8A05DRAFT_35190 [Staphylotrichum longicolle]
MDSNEPGARPAKRKRLNFACNHCRSRKVRCDQQEPSCRGCLAAGVACITTNKRRPEVEVRRRPAGSQPDDVQEEGSRPGPGPSRQPLPGLVPVGLVQRGMGPATPASEPATTNRSPSTLSVAAAAAPHGLGRGGGGGDHVSPGRFAGRLPMAPRISGGDTLEIMTGWLELAFHRLGLPSGFDSCLWRPKAAQEALLPRLGVPLALPPFPPAAHCRAALAAYGTTVHALYPILDWAVLDRICEEVVSGVVPVTAWYAERLPELLLFCLAFVLGSAAAAVGGEDPAGEPSSELATAYVGFCETMLGHVLGWGTLDAVRVSFLLALTLRWREKIASAWPLAGVCVSLAQVLGLDRRKAHGRRSPGVLISEDADQERRRVWWCVYSFEKLFAFELGRPSVISDSDHDQLEPSPSHDSPDPDFFQMVISLARTLSEVSTRSIAARTKEELAGAGREGLENAIRFKVATTGELVLLLMRWDESLPKNLRPTSDLLCEPAEAPLAAFISVQYHSAIIMLLRNTLLISDEAIRNAIEEHAAGTPWGQVTRNGQAIVANSARSMAKIFIEGHDLGSRPVLHTVAAPLLALSVLSVHLIRHPTSRLAGSDISLIHNAGEFAIEKYERIAKDQRIHGVVQLLDNEVTRIVAAAQPKATARLPSIAVPTSRIIDDSPAAHSSNTVHNRGAGVTLDQPRQGFGQAYGGLPADLLDLPAGIAMPPMQMPDDAWSPMLADEIGWDWGDFSQLFAERPI